MKKKFLEEHVMHGTLDFPIGIYRFDTNEDIHIPTHYHKEFEFLVLTEGHTILQLENNSIELNKSEGVFINSGTIHSAFSVKNVNSSFIAIVFAPTFIAPEEDNLYKKFIHPVINNELTFPVKLPEEVVNIIIETNDFFNNADFGYELTVKGNIARMLSMCLANAEKCYSAKNDHKAEIVKTILDYIHINYGSIITLHDLATMSHMSKEHLCRIFHDVTNVSPIVYLNRYRIMQIAYMLRNTDKPISEISSCCGFNNSSYFNKMFMRFMKCTPTEYRFSQK